MTGFLLAALCAAVPADPGADVYALLKARGVGVDSGAAARATAEAIVRIADPGARFFDAAEAAAFASRPIRPPELRELGEGVFLLKVEAIDEAAAALTASGLVRAASAGGGFILDCRGAGGTNLAAADSIAAHFADTDIFLYAVQDGAGADLELHGAPPAQRAETPVVMLTDRATSEAAELLAALLSRVRGVLLVGENTKGDAARREMTPLSVDRYAYMASGRFVLPDGSTWEGGGVAPHMPVSGETATRSEIGTNGLSRAGKPLEETAIRHRELFAAVRRDGVLARALDLVLGLKALAVFPEKVNAPSVAESR